MASQAQRRSAWVLGLALFASYAYFYQAGGWNQNSRFALVRAIVERHTLQIDAYQLHTGDRALWQGHYYSDKAPGASLLALAPVVAARGISRMAGVDPEGFPGIAWTSYVAGVVTNAIFTVFAALAIWWLALRWGSSPGAALFGATAYGLATPAWCYATLFMGHGLTAGCLMGAFAAAVALEDDDERRQRRLGWIVGLGTGWAVVSEFPALIPAVLIVGLALLTLRDRWPDRLPAIVARLVAGGAAAAIVLLVYNAMAFGSPLHLGYASEEGFAQMRHGVFGITYPTPYRLYQVLLGSYRGLLPIAPLVALTPIGLVALARQPARRRAVCVAAASGLFYVLLNASYFYWEGGWAYGPRQMMAGLPFLALGLTPLWDRWRAIGRAVLAAGWIWGAALTLIAVSTTPQPPATFKAPMQELLWPAFRDGDLSLNPQTFVHNSADAGRLRGNQVPHASWNLGEIAGLHGLTSLLPLAFVWIVAAALLIEMDSYPFAVRSSSKKGYDPISEGDGPRQFGNNEANVRFIDASGVATPGAEALEIGTGTGLLLQTLLQRGCRARGVELREELIAEAHRWFGALPIDRVTGVTLPFPDASFDVVMSFDVFEHIPDSDAHLREVNRVLRPSGTYLIQTPNKWTNVVFETIRWRSFTKFRDDHCSLHTLGDLRRRLARHGFDARAYDIPVVNDFFRAKVRRYLGPLGVLALRVVNPDRLPLAWRTNLYVKATKRA